MRVVIGFSINVAVVSTFLAVLLILRRIDHVRLRSAVAVTVGAATGTAIAVILHITDPGRFPYPPVVVAGVVLATTFVAAGAAVTSRTFINELDRIDDRRRQ